MEDLNLKRNIKGSKILVTGASGFIGSKLTLKLLELGAIVYGISRKENNNNSIKWLKGDLSNLDFVRDIIKQIQPDYIFHLASHVLGSRDVEHVMSTFNDNLVTTVNLLNVAHKYPCKKIILAGSFEEGLFNGNEVIPSSPYAAAKIAASNYARMFYELYKTPVSMASLYMVYGPGQKDLSKLVPYVILKTLKGEPAEISSGIRKIDWIYVDDVVSGLIAMLTAPNIDGHTIELGTGKSISIKEFVSLLSQMIDPSIKPRFGAIKERPLEQENNADVVVSTRKIGWKPVTELNAGLQKTINYYSEL